MSTVGYNGPVVYNGLGDCLDKPSKFRDGNYSIPVATGFGIAPKSGSYATLAITYAGCIVIKGVNAVLAANASVAPALIADSAGLKAQAVSTTAFYAILSDVSGNLYAFKGVDGAGMPGIPQTYPVSGVQTDTLTLAPIAILKIVAGSTASAFTFGTSNFNATGITPTQADLSTLPEAGTLPI